MTRENFLLPLSSSALSFSSLVLLFVFSNFLSGQGEGVDLNFRDGTHFHSNEELNEDPEHEAFLGKVKEDDWHPDQLTTEEGEERLAAIVVKMDKDKNGLVTKLELQEWIKFIQRRDIIKDVKRRWQGFKLNHGSLFSRDKYFKETYGFLSNDYTAEIDGSFDHMRKMMARDKTRFTAADKDKDDKLTQSEFADFLYPEESERMQHIVRQETLDDMDKDKDGFVSLDEFIANMNHPESGTDDEIRERIADEKAQFKEIWDQNQDGKLDKEELKDWILPPGFDHINEETEHLLMEADMNKDGKLSKEEIIGKYDVFVGSQATDFGEALKRHNEF